MSLGSIVNLVAGKVAELAVEEAKFLYGVKGEVESLTKELNSMNDFLGKMEAMDEEGGDEQSRTTIKEMRKLAYDAEDVIETYILEVSSSVDKKENLFKRYLCLCSCLVRTHQVGAEIEVVTKSINNTMERWKKYQVDQHGATTYASERSKRRGRFGPIAYAHNIEDHVVGLDEDINKLIEVLTADDTKIQVASIVGMGGSGKTTLARKLFNHEDVIAHFKCMAWVSISQKWVARQVLLDLLKSVYGETKQVDESWSLEVAAGKLHRYLKEKTYLIVLDDVWEEEALKMILPALPLASNGKKILVTTRNQVVVDYPDLKRFTYTHKPRRLNKDESWELFTKIAFIHSEESGYFMDISELEELGKEMLDKCGGLPLAVIALAGILHGKQTLDEWQRVNKAVSLRIMADGKGTHLYGPVNQMLLLSYYDMPRELKPCLLYLSRYPEDHQISVKELLRMWIAEGFITTDKLREGDTLEDVARQYLNELVNRCVVQIARTNYAGEVRVIQIHDLVRELCINKAKEEDFLEIFSSKHANLDAITTEARRVAISSTVPIPTKSQSLRSLFLYDGSYSVELNLQAIYQNFRLLRVLLLEHVRTSDDTLPTGIGRLIHLRYLGLRNTKITQLPSSIGKLRNLLTLDYRNDYINEIQDVRIPDVVWEIEGLRHLYLPLETGEIVEVDNLHLHTLKNMQTLYGGSIGGSWMLKELPRLSPSVRKLQLHGITSEKQLEAAFKCPSIVTDRLYSLDLRWDNESEEGDEAVKLDSLESIIHSQHLRKLRLAGRMGDRLAGCGIQFPTSIHKLVLRSSRFGAEATLVALGKLPHLMILQLWGDAYTGTNWTCSAGEFPQLKELVLYGLEDLEEWSIERGAMPQLMKLCVGSCEKLSRIPERLKFITTLQELILESMSDEFTERIKGGGEDAHIIQHVPLVILD